MVASLFTIFFISLLTAGDANELRPRPVIVGGIPIKIEEAPFVAICQRNDKYCGASILTERFVLSAAHCYSPCAEGGVIVGAQNLDNFRLFYPVEKAIVHPLYGLDDSKDFDVLVLKLLIKLTFSKKVQPIKMANPDFVIQSGTNMEVFGYGDTEIIDDQRILRKVVIPYVSFEECSEIYNKINEAITKNMLCAGEPGKGSCYGDSGGPLVVNNTLVGVVSTGDNNTCTARPGVFTSVSALRDFIDDVIWINS